MADEKEPEANPMGDLWWLLFVLFIIIIVWFLSGGPTRADFSSLFLQAPNGIFGGNATGTPSATTSGNALFPVVSSGGGAKPLISGDSAFNKQYQELQKNPSSFQGLIGFANVDGARQNDPSQEYIVIQAAASVQTPVNITGWRVQSLSSKNTAVIGTAIIAPILGSAALPGPVTLAAGTEAVVNSGRSPIGVSFMLNKCSGYLSQFQKFSPPIETVCPSATSELLTRGGSLSGEPACRTAASQIGFCKVLLGAPSGVGVSPQCSQFLMQTATYNTCVIGHRDEYNFNAGQWRLFEGSSANLWHDGGDTLVLLDAQGRLVSAVSY